jgi:phage terminase large subunit-like protein
VTPEQIEVLLAGLDEGELEALMRDWALWARPAQLPPTGDWTTWLMIGGRGSGKTRAGAEWVRALAAEGIGPIALVGESMVEAEAVMVAGQSGILRVAAPDERPLIRGNAVFWPNGVEAQLFGAADPERLRGPQFAAAWCDELAKWSHAEAAWDNLQFGLRLGSRPRQLVTTTPRPTRLMKRLLGEPGIVVTRMATRENADHLAGAFLDAVVKRYEGSVLGRQELDGELIEDRPDALWTRASFRPDSGVARGRTVVAIDPPATSRRTSDACGIIVAAEAGEGAVVLADLSFAPAPPEVWASRAVAAFREFEADCILAEVNQGGEMVRAVIAQQDPDVPIREARASRGKWLRAEPVAALYARGRVAHVPGLQALEDEMCAFGTNGLSDGHSPDRVDALVWALTELLLDVGRPRVRHV